MLARTLAVLVAALVLAPAAAASAPAGLHGFVLRADENPSPHTFARTPSFAWSRVVGAKRYELELSTSRDFSENAVAWASDTIQAPFTDVPLTLPWTSGSPYAWYAHVRAWLGPSRVTRWSSPYGFNLKPPGAPQSLSSGVNPRPGLIRWTPVAGATAYQFNFIYDPSTGESRTWTSPTTAADLREFYMFHNQVASDPTAVVQWRVRAVRAVLGKTLNDLKPVSFGPWSDVNTTIEPDLDTTSPISLGGTISRSGATNVVSTDVLASEPHSLMPGFWWSGALSRDGFGTTPCLDVGDPVQATGVTCPLFHVYVFSDSDCVNRVYTSDLVGSPAFVPRLEEPLDLPTSVDGLTDAADAILGNAQGGGEGLVYDVSNERVYAAGTGPGASTSGGREVTLWDSDRADGRWWWTVVPAVPHENLAGTIEYRDVELPQDKCEAGDVQGFRKTSEAAVEGESGVPYVSGQAADGHVRAAGSDRPSFYDRVIVAWKPAPAADRYEVQWSRKASPWKTVVDQTTPATSAAFRLDTGVWHYRVRGLDKSILGSKDGMTWSAQQYVKILPRTFVVSRVMRPALP